MIALSLPTFPHQIKNTEKGLTIYDVVRQKHVALTPEEWVRQHFIHFLINQHHCKKGLMAVEKAISFNGMLRRCDIVVYNRLGAPQIIVECKAPHIAISQQVFDQVARYNMVLKVSYLIVTNGMETFCCHIDYESQSYRYVEHIDFQSILN